MSHTICHLEIPTIDMKKSRKFYKKIFDWNMDYGWSHGYAIFRPGKKQLDGELDARQL